MKSPPLGLIMTCKPIVRFLLANELVPNPGVVPPSVRLLHSSIRSAPAFCAFIAESILSTHISNLYFISIFSLIFFVYPDPRGSEENQFTSAKRNGVNTVSYTHLRAH